MKFWFAFTLYDLAEANMSIDQKKKANALWEEILASPRGITSEHRKLVTPQMLQGLGAKTAEDYVRNYALFKLNRR